MNTLTRKQREIADRHTRFLDIAKSLIEEDGYGTLSMDRIAELAEYSKGTVYQHFSCKEEILIQLCNQNGLTLKSLFERACSHQGGSRERLLAIGIAHEIWKSQNPICDELSQTLHGGGTMEKVSAESRDLYNKLEVDILGLVGSVVTAAIYDGDLDLAGRSTVPELVFGIWSLCHGGLQLRGMGLPLDEMGIPAPYRALMNTLDATLDGFGWRPLSSEHDYREASKNILENIFADEIAHLANNGTAVFN